MEEANGKTATVKKRVKSKKKGKHRNSGKNENFKAWKLMPNQNLGENLRNLSTDILTLRDKLLIRRHIFDLMSKSVQH